jgi:hypothetical protein
VFAQQGDGFIAFMGSEVHNHGHKRLPSMSSFPKWLSPSSFSDYSSFLFFFAIRLLHISAFMVLGKRWEGDEGY